MAHSDEFLRTLADIPSFRDSEFAIRLMKALPKHPTTGASWDALARLVFDVKKGNVKERSAAFRSLLYRVKQWLDEAYADPSSPLQQYPRAKIVAHGRRYALHFLSEGTRPHVTAFWKPYLICEDKARQLQTSDRFFLRLGDHFYFRDIQSPGRPDLAHFLEPICYALGLPPGPFSEAGLSRLREETLRALATGMARFLSDAENWGKGRAAEIETEQVLQAIISKFKPDVSRHYVSAGESVALTHIAELFQDFRKPVIFGNRAGIANDSETSNIIQVGKPREGGPLAAILDSRRFRVLRDQVADTKDTARTALQDHLRTYADEVSEGAEPGRFKYALITRCPHRQAPQIITSIIASHGRVTESAARHLTDEISLAEVFKELKWNLNSVPPVFQFVLKAEVSYGKDSDRTAAKITGVAPGWYNTD
jgi:hypothetical protein